MPGEIVGEAFVRIKALTSNLAKDIEKDVKKALNDANLEKAAAAKGDGVGEAYGDGVSDSAKKTLDKNSKDFVPGDDILDGFGRVIKDVQKDFEQLSFDLPELDVDIEPMEEALDVVRKDHDKLSKDIDNGKLGKSLDKLSKKFKNLGSDGSPGIGLLKNKMVLLGGAVVAALPLIQDVGSAVLSYATGLVAEIGFLGTALGGLGAAAAAAVGASAVAILPIFLAFKSNTTFLTHFKESLKETGQEFLAIGTATQQTLLPALDESLGNLERLIPMLSEFGLFVGRAAGNFALLASETLTGNVAQGRFQSILQSSLRMLDVLFPALIDVGGILSGLWVAALPAGERFVEIVADLTDKWNDMIVEGLRTGELTNTFDTWFERARVLGSALSNLSGALLDILSIGADSSSSVFTRFDEWAERFRAFTESEAGQNRFKTIFDNALAVMREINGITADLFEGIFGRLTETGGVDSMVAALQKFRDVIPEIKDAFQGLLDTIRPVTSALASSLWERLQKTWDKLADPVGRLADQFFDLLEVMGKTGAFDVFLDLMAILADTLSVLLDIPGFAQFLAYFLAFGSAIKVMSIVLNPFVRLFGTFGSLLVNLLRGAITGQLSGMAGGLQKLATGFKAVSAANTGGSLVKALSIGAGEAGNLAGALGGVGSAILGNAGLLAAFAAITVPAAIIGGIWIKNKIEQHRWNQEIRQTTEALGLLNDGLNITAEGVTKYIRESSRFKTHDQIDDIATLGLSIDALGKSVAEGTIAYQDFAQLAIDVGQVEIVRRDSGGGNRIDGYLAEISSLESLADQYDLTAEQIEKLSKGEKVSADGISFRLEGNASLIESFKELNEVIGAAAKENIGTFAANAQNLRLLGRNALGDIVAKLNDATDEDAGRAMVGVQKDLEVAARKAAHSFKGLSTETRAQVLEQSRAADGTVLWTKYEQGLIDALSKQNIQIRDNLKLFASADFAKNFGPAKKAVVEFSDLVNSVDFSGLNPFDSIDNLIDKFPQVGGAALNLFDQLKQLPEAEFNAAATALGTDADVLRGAMEGATQAIADLQQQALDSLPSVGQLLDDATKTKKDGSEFFDRDAFVDSIKQRTTDTQQFGDNIARIQRDIGDEAAALAVQQGPEAAANLVTMIGHNEGQLDAALKAMEESEAALSEKIKTVLGPGIALEYATQAQLVGNAWGPGLAQGLQSPETLTALQDASLSTLNELARGFQGKFIFVNNELKFINTGHFSRVERSSSGGGAFNKTAVFSEGGFVGKSVFGSAFSGGPKGTDTVPAWLTPGEFVLRQSIARAIPPSVLTALNAGDPRLMSLLTSLNRNRPGSPAAQAAASGGATPTQASKGDFIIHELNIEAPTPLESARQTVERLRIMQAQMASR